MNLLSKFNHDEKLKSELIKMNDVLFTLKALDYVNKTIDVRYLLNGRMTTLTFKPMDLYSYYRMWKKDNMKSYPIEISKFTKYLIDCEQGKTVEPFYIGKCTFNENLNTFISFVGAMRIAELNK